jgi:CRISPR-associated endonuclease/helicase Cas3
MGYYARYSRDRNCKQFLKKHLKDVSCMTSTNASKIGLEIFGKYLGLSHDLGKYSKEFQNYINSNDKTKKGKIVHAKAGAKLFYKNIKDADKSSNFLKELLALCCMSHHTNLIDMLDLEGNDKFHESLDKQIFDFEDNIESEIKQALADIDVEQEQIRHELDTIIKKIEKGEESIPKHFYLGMLAKFVLSCLIDADHTNSADFELQKKADYCKKNKYISWETISERLEKHLKELNEKNESNGKVKSIRKQISDDCLKSGKLFEKGCYKLEVPTGGGKTLASFRFAVEMSKRHNLERIIYCIPYTTIIEQNAETIRKIVEIEEVDKGKVVLEHHSNLSQKDNMEQEALDLNEILTQNWDAPIIFTTNVQILETFFGRKTTSIRRLHQLANSVIIFDEIQTLPIKCVHIFNNAINFLVDICGATVVLCTATQPLLDNISDDEKIKNRGMIKLSGNQNIVSNNSFNELKRVEIKSCLNKVYKSDEIAAKAMEFVEQNNNCLVVCNTTESARSIWEKINVSGKYRVYHLSARMMPIHRKWVLRCIKKDLRNKKRMIVVSTQVIEAGVDVDFNCGIRAIAGLDSILQVAGRINRNGNLKNGDGINIEGHLLVCEFDENIDLLNDIAKGKESSKIILKKNINMDVLKSISDYYEDYFYQRTKEMQYLCEHGNTLLDLLSENKKYNNKAAFPKLNQSFKEASSQFRAIDNITQLLIIDKGKARRIIKKFECSFDPVKKYRLMHDLYKYSVNIYPREQEKFYKLGVVHKIKDDLEIFYLDTCYYKNFGISEKSAFDEGGMIV